MELFVDYNPYLHMDIFRNKFGQLLLVAGEYLTAKINIWKVKFETIKHSTVKRLTRTVSDKDARAVSSIYKRTIRDIPENDQDFMRSIINQQNQRDFTVVDVENKVMVL